MKDLNFFSQYIGKQKQKRFSFERMAPYIIGVLILVVLASSVLVYFEVSRYEKQIAEIRKYLDSPQVKASIKKYDDTAGKMQVMQGYYSLVTKLAADIDNNEIVDSNLLNNISSTIPQQLFIKTMKIDGKGIAITGAADDRTIVAEFEHNLKELGIFKSVHIANETSGSQDSIESCVFALDCVLGDVNQNEANE